MLQVDIPYIRMTKQLDKNSQAMNCRVFMLSGAQCEVGTSVSITAEQPRYTIVRLVLGMYRSLAL